MRRLALTIIALAMTLSISAQFSIDAGLAVGGFKNSGMDNYNNKTGVTAGAYYAFKISDFEAEQAGEFLNFGLQFTQTGYQSNNLEGKTSWIQLPVVSRTKCSLGDDFSLFVDAGIFFGFALKSESTFNFLYAGQKEYVDLSGSIRKFNFGGNFGVGLAYDRFSLLLSWQRGLLNLMGNTPEIGNTPVYSTNSFCTKSWRLTLGIEL